MREGTAERRAELYREAVHLIEREYASDLQLNDVARRLATSRRQLQRAFAEAGETTFRDDLARVRMRRARELLAADSLPVRVIAASVGYHQPAQFAKSFRRHHGAAPSRFRKQQRSPGAAAAPTDPVSAPASGNGDRGAGLRAADSLERRAFSMR